MTLEIANGALDHLGVPPLETLAVDTEAARVINRNIDKAIRYTLRMAQWTEATITICPDQVPVEDCDMPEEFCFAFRIPDDFAAAYDVSQYHEAGEDAYEKLKCPQRVVNWSVRKAKVAKNVCRVLFTDECPVLLEYVCHGNVERLPQDIQDLIALDLAARAVTPLKSNGAKRAELKQEFRMLMAEAASISAGQDNGRLEIPDGDLLGARESRLVGSGSEYFPNRWRR